MLCGVALLVCANILWVDCCPLADENTVSCTFQLLFLFQVYSVLRWCVCSKWCSKWIASHSGFWWLVWVTLLTNINKVGSPFRILLDLLWCSPHSSFLCSDLAYASAQSSFCSLVVSVAIGFCRNQGLWCLSSPRSNSMWHEIFRPCLDVLQKKFAMKSC